MNATSIRTLAEQAVDAFHRHGYTERSVEERRWILCRIVEQHEKRGVGFFCTDIVSQFVHESEKRYIDGEIQRTHYRFLTKTATYLAELHNTGTINFAKRFVPRLPDYYESILNDILINEMWSEKGRRSVWQFAKVYFGWLASEGYGDLHAVNELVLRRYLIDCSSRMVGSSLDNTRRMLKKLYIFLDSIGIAANSYEQLLSFSVPVGKKIKRPVPHSEIAAVLNAIDRDTIAGKRDYAMILLSAVTGLRAIDIAELKLDDIDWRNGEIKIIQSKTEKPLALPLTTDIGTAIRDYILNGRPESNLPNVFLRIRAPIKKISRSIPYGQFNQYRQRVGLPKCSFHGLRRALGSNLVISGVPITTVAQVLGHSDIDSTKQYISLDTVHLKECALDFEGIAPMVRNRGGSL